MDYYLTPVRISSDVYICQCTQGNMTLLWLLTAWSSYRVTISSRQRGGPDGGLFPPHLISRLRASFQNEHDAVQGEFLFLFILFLDHHSGVKISCSSKGQSTLSGCSHWISRRITGISLLILFAYVPSFNMPVGVSAIIIALQNKYSP